MQSRHVSDGFALPAHRGRDHDGEDQRRADHEHEAQGARDEHAWIAAREQHRAPQVLFHERSEDVAENERRRLAFELDERVAEHADERAQIDVHRAVVHAVVDRKSTRLNSSHGYISYAVFCLKKKKMLRAPDRGRTWSSDLRTHHNALDPALAVNSEGTVGLLYQQLSGSGAAERWVTRLETHK